MRGRWLVLVGCIACGDNNREVIDAPIAPPPIDADEDPPDAGLSPRCQVTPGSTLSLREIAVVGDMPVLITSPPGDDRLFVVEKPGTIRIVRNGMADDPPFLDLSAAAGGPVVNAAQEMGLLGLAFHPEYATNRRFFVYYTGGAPYRVNVVSELTTSIDDPDRADPVTLRELVVIRDPDTNHNGGMMQFDHFGYLVIGTGDGGSGGDPWGHGQDPDELLAKLLRIDVDNPGATTPYGIPPQNPFALGGGRPEILALGLRNPWRWSFDRVTWDIYIGDVGQNRYEEVSVLSPDALVGANFGWNEREGMHCRLPTGGCQVDGLTDPVIEMQHFAPDLNCAVVGGEVYRGGCFPDLVGRYFFIDYCVGVLRSFRMVGGVVTDEVTHIETDVTRPTSLHGDAYGELFLTAASGRIYAVEVAPR